jgi:hypothetical protein
MVRVSELEARMEVYKLKHMELRIEDLLAFPMQIAEHVRMGVAEANSFKQECADMSKKVERLVQLLRQAARFSSGNNMNNYSAGLYERPTKRIMLEVTKALERVLVLVKKCKRSGILKRVMTITNTADFRKVNLLLESSIGDVTWLLNISTSGEDRPEYIGLPPIAATDPILGLVWEQISIVHVGTPDQKADAAVNLENLAKDNERNVQIIIEEGGVLPLLWLLKEGTVSGQEAAARALGQLARDQEQVKAMRDVGACATFTHILGNHATSMKVQVGVTTILLDKAQSQCTHTTLFLPFFSVGNSVMYNFFTFFQCVGSALLHCLGLGRVKLHGRFHSLLLRMMKHKKSWPRWVQSDYLWHC